MGQTIFFTLLWALVISTLCSCGENNPSSDPVSDSTFESDDTDNHFVNQQENQNSPTDNPSESRAQIMQEGLLDGINHGIAHEFRNDVGIANHPDVYAAEDFETGQVDLYTEEDRLATHLTVVDDEVYTGEWAASYFWIQGQNGPTTRFLLPTDPKDNPQGTYFVRACYNFDRSFHPEDQNQGVGVKGIGIYAEGPTTTDTNWYNASVQFVGWGNSAKPEANDGYLWVGHLYSYNPYPDKAIPEVGTLNNVSDYRFSAYADPFDYIRFNTWRCYEVGLYLNTPGQPDGEARFWIDGVLQSRITHMQYRDQENPRPVNVNINLHRTTENFPHTMTRWMDNIVIARRYIGPVHRN